MTAGQKRRFDRLPFTLPIDAQLYRFAVDHKRARWCRSYRGRTFCRP